MPSRFAPRRSCVAEEQAEQPAQEELLDQLEEQLKQLKVSDVLIQTVFTVSSLGYQKLGEEDRDLEQARLAIETLRALVPVLKQAVPEQVGRDLEQTLANMQLAYARAAAA